MAKYQGLSQLDTLLNLTTSSVEYVGKYSINDIRMEYALVVNQKFVPKNKLTI